MGGTQDNATRQFTTAGLDNTTTVGGGDGGFCHINQKDPNIQIISYLYNNYYVSTDGGNTFAGKFFGHTGKFINPTDYDDNIETVSSEVIKSILEIDGVLSNPAPAVNFSAFNDSTINLTVNFWITYPGTDFTATKNEAAIRLRKLAQSGLFDMPFPIRTMIQASDKTKKSKQYETSPN